ncbi:MAG: hypothetical protein ACD_83C00281G0003 [uncultured bacterium]|uniref:Uncharacterized protein n=1 Tax=Berkelbacteria bacterium GW2011_GWA2_38_9 TaxID=1618334 RepID=A0A0G0NUU3_9BACT|nr:MAG: hypothetical protein ACD_83C00281G0003 [uncultured bacterium]KKQ89604.1 MAG: hypothetical protein UT11_C0022G0007 [Berkelbacteria bacterium GW2011_GWA2_38_9]
MAEEKSKSAKTEEPKHEESVFAHAIDHPAEPADGENSSGMHGSVPPEIMGGWNWGAFLLGWIWGIGHSVWIALLSFIVPWPIMEIILGVKGNEWAWQNRRFESVEHFKEVQRKWAIWGVLLFIISALCIIALFTSLILISLKQHRDVADQDRIKREEIRKNKEDWIKKNNNELNNLFNDTSDTATNTL